MALKFRLQDVANLSEADRNNRLHSFVGAYENITPQETLASLETELARFEHKHHLSSADMFSSKTCQDLEQDDEFNTWATMYVCHLHLLEQQTSR